MHINGCHWLVTEFYRVSLSLCRGNDSFFIVVFIILFVCFVCFFLLDFTNGLMACRPLESTRFLPNWKRAGIYDFFFYDFFFFFDHKRWKNVVGRGGGANE